MANTHATVEQFIPESPFHKTIRIQEQGLSASHMLFGLYKDSADNTGLVTKLSTNVFFCLSSRLSADKKC